MIRSCVEVAGKLHHNELKGPYRSKWDGLSSVLSEKFVHAIRCFGLPAGRAWGVQPLAKGSFSLEVNSVHR
jgi:hypothetical protein